MVDPYHGVLFSNEKGHTILTHNSQNESSESYAKFKKDSSKRLHTVCRCNLHTDWFHLSNIFERFYLFTFKERGKEGEKE